MAVHFLSFTIDFPQFFWSWYITDVEAFTHHWLIHRFSSCVSCCTSCWSVSLRYILLRLSLFFCYFPQSFLLLFVSHSIFEGNPLVYFDYHLFNSQNSPPRWLYLFCCFLDLFYHLPDERSESFTKNSTVNEFGQFFLCSHELLSMYAGKSSTCSSLNQDDLLKNCTIKELLKSCPRFFFQEHFSESDLEFTFKLRLCFLEQIHDCNCLITVFLALYLTLQAWPITSDKLIEMYSNTVSSLPDSDSFKHTSAS